MCHLLLLLNLCLLIAANEFDNTGKTVTFYPSSLMIAHNSRPLIFYADTHILNLNVKLKTTPFGKIPTVTIQCSQSQQIFMNMVLSTIRQAHKNIRRLLSLPGFSNLIECDNYLRTSFEFETKLTSNMICPRAYRPSLRSCKQWALAKCTSISPDEKTWLKRLSRARRSAWACHSGMLGLIRKIYTSFGGSCNSDKLVGLKRTLTDMTNALEDERTLITSVNGKTVQLLKITDKLTSRINTFADTFSIIDKTLTTWKGQINRFAKTEKCHYDSVLDFTSKFASETSKTFNSMLRFFEIHDILNQFNRIQGKELVGYNDLPESLSSALTLQLQKQREFRHTAKALADGFPILMNPLTQYEHRNRYISLHTFLTLPRITTSTAFCTIEYF